MTGKVAVSRKIFIHIGYIMRISAKVTQAEDQLCVVFSNFLRTDKH